MEQQENPPDRERFCCSICLDLLKDPVTTGCGHSYCRSCINTLWDNGDQTGSYSCPQCGQTFTPRPVLGTNTMLADSLEELKKTGLQAAAERTERIRPLRHSEDAAAAVSQVRGRQQDILSETETETFQIVSQVDVLLPQPEPQTRADFLRYSQEITLDPNTANRQLLLSEGNRKVKRMSEDQSYSDHPDRFTDWSQVLSRESLTGPCYWEVKMRGGASVAVTYKDISRAGESDECEFGYNDKSWMLYCSGDRYYFRYNSIETPVSGPWSSRVGVYLDHSAGVLSFYSVSDTMTLLHRVQTTFTQPLCAGVDVDYPGDTAEFCKLE